MCINWNHIDFQSLHGVPILLGTNLDVKPAATFIPYSCIQVVACINSHAKCSTMTGQMIAIKGQAVNKTDSGTRISWPRIGINMISRLFTFADKWYKDFRFPLHRSTCPAFCSMRVTSRSSTETTWCGCLGSTRPWWATMPWSSGSRRKSRRGWRRNDSAGSWCVMWDTSWYTKLNHV